MPTQAQKKAELFKTIQSLPLEQLKNFVQSQAHALNSQELLTGNTLIMYAAYHGQQELFNWLLHNPSCDLNIVNNSNCSVLTFAILRGEPNYVETIINSERFDKKALIIHDRTPSTPLQLALKRAESETDRNKIEKYREIITLLENKIKKLKNESTRP